VSQTTKSWYGDPQGHALAARRRRTQRILKDTVKVFNLINKDIDSTLTSREESQLRGGVQSWAENISKNLSDVKGMGKLKEDLNVLTVHADTMSKRDLLITFSNAAQRIHQSKGKDHAKIQKIFGSRIFGVMDFVKIERKALSTALPLVPKEFEVIITLEEEMNRTLRKILDQQRKEMLTAMADFHRGRSEVKAFTDNNIMATVISIINFDKIEAKLKSIVKRIVGEGHDSVEKELDLNITHTPGFQELMENRILADVKNLEADLRKRLQGELLTGWQAGEGIDGLKARIQETWDNKNLTSARAEMIARTETQIAYNGGRYNAAVASSVPLMKQWNAFFDNRTGEDSKKLEGQIRPLKQDFFDKENMQFIPYPPNRPNCRCRVDFIPITS